LKEQVSYSTIDLEFYQTITQELQAADEKTAKDKFSEALASGWQGVVAIGVALTYIWPLLLIAAAAALLWIRFRNIRREGTKLV
jgi:hypothetical protein